jgi:hypothetical protein
MQHTARMHSDSLTIVTASLPRPSIIASGYIFASRLASAMSRDEGPVPASTSAMKPSEGIVS